ncbi:MAG: hypothetical protein LC795_17150 [Acidobacteria bacterium]|nr:hypothetical protein [Acidobacteriota bacterium]
MSTVILDQSATGLTFQGSVPTSIPLPKPESNLSLLITAPGVSYKLEAPIVDNPIVEDHSIKVRFVVDDDVYLGLNLMGESVKQENEFKVGQFYLYYQIEEQRPRAHFVADTLMAFVGLAGKLDLKISEPEVRTNLNMMSSLLEISEMLHRRQTAYRLMVIEKMIGKQVLLPPALSEGEIDKVAFVYNALVNQSFIWSGGSLSSAIPATQENASQFAQDIQPFSYSVKLESFNETVLGQPINLGPVTITLEDAVVKNLDEVRNELGAEDGRQVIVEIHSRQEKCNFEFVGIPDPSNVLWEPKIQALIDLESYLDAAITERYHALAAATLAGLTEDEKEEVTTRPAIGEAFLINNSDGE